MTATSFASAGSLLDRARTLLAARHLVFHDGRRLRRVTLSAATRAGLASGAALVIGLAGYGAAAAAADVAHAAGVAGPSATAMRLERMEHDVARMQARVATIRATATLHAARIEQRQALLDAALTGTGAAKQMALATLAIDPAADRVSAHAIAPFRKVEARQVALAAAATRHLQSRYDETTRTIRQLGLKTSRIVRGTAMGGPLVEANSPEARADLAADAQFRSLFMTWKKLDTLQQGVIAIPSVQPVERLKFTSNFGIRSDPFRGTAAMHAGVDIPGPVGTPIYATADGVISHAARQGGYGNMVEINHGKGIATRYGHLSRILVADNTRVKRGQLIALMGSTGRSTGPHLHYEVRIDGHAVNPVPFLTTADYLLAAQDRSVGQIPVSTSGPVPQD